MALFGKRPPVIVHPAARGSGIDERTRSTQCQRMIKKIYELRLEITKHSSVDNVGSKIKKFQDLITSVKGVFILLQRAANTAPKTATKQAISRNIAAYIVDCDNAIAGSALYKSQANDSDNEKVKKMLNFVLYAQNFLDEQVQRVKKIGLQLGIVIQPVASP